MNDDFLYRDGIRSKMSFVLLSEEHAFIETKDNGKSRNRECFEDMFSEKVKSLGGGG